MADALVTASAIGDTAVVAAVAGKKIRVRQVVLSAVTANNAKLRSGTTDRLGLIYLPATQTVVLAAPSGDFLFETAAGAALNVNLSAATAVSVFVVYSLE